MGIVAAIRCFAFNTAMPTACKHLVGASVFGELPLPFGPVRARFNIDLGMLGGNCKGSSPQAARNKDHLCNRVPGTHVHGAGRFAEHQVDGTCVPFGFDQPASNAEAVGRTVQRGQEQAIHAG